MKDIKDALEWLLDAVRIWVRCIARPVATLNAVLPGASDEHHLSGAAKVWVPSLLISLVLSFPMLNLFGIEWNNLGFHLSNWLTTVLALVAVGFIAHRILTALKLKSEFVRTLVMYTTPVVAYSPIITLINLPGTIQLFDAVKAIKEQKLPIDVAAITLARNLLGEGTIQPGPLVATTTFLVSIFGFGCLAVFAEAVSQWYGNSRFKSYSAVAAALMLSTIVTMGIVVPIQLFTIYSFLKLD